jgi:filamentous hemagglutinin
MYRCVSVLQPSSIRRGSSRRGVLLATASALALVIAGPGAHARPLGVGGVFVAPTVALEAAQAAAQQAATIAKQSASALARANQTIQSMQAVQSAARNLAKTGGNSLGAGLPAVTDGLWNGGLVPDSGLAAPGKSNPVTTWINANAPSQQTSNGQTIVTVQQTGQYALLNWQQFNIGKNTTLFYDQAGNSNWVALNKINDPSGIPSQILGSIKASGAIYLINQNGIIFGGSSQLNVNTLIASSLNLNDSYATSPAQSNFLNGKGILSSGSPSFNSVDSGGNAYTAGAVTVQAGAQITAPGGDVLLLAPVVRNDGAISTPSGQTLLLGGNDVLLSTGDSFTRGFVVLPNPNAANPNVPGTSFASTSPGSVINNGAISSPQGNITIVAGSVAQNGVLISTTSTTANGSINIQAQAGNLVLGGANDNPLYSQYGVAAQPSLTQILPDANDQALITDSQAIANSSILLSGVNVDIRGIVQLHGYDVTNANDQPGGITISATGTVDNSGGVPVPVPGRVFLEDQSILDASGTTDAVASASRNSVKVELRSNELRDFPVVKAGLLYQLSINVDASASGTRADGTSWQGTPLADASAWIALTTRSLDERLMNGAPINIGGAIVSAGVLPAQLVQAGGSIVNISGGYTTYTPGFVRVTTLVTTDGRLVSATNADPTVAYMGVCCSFTVNHAHWGVTEIFTSALRSSGYNQPGYIQGGAGGSLNLAVSAAVLDGQVYGSVVTGEKQTTLASAPAGAGLFVNATIPPTPQNAPLFITDIFDTDRITVSDAAAAAALTWTAGFDVGSDLNTSLTSNSVPSNSVYIPAAWLNSGLTNVNLGANAKISLPAGNAITLPAGGKFTANANTLDIASSIAAPGGSIALTGDYTSASSAVDSPTAPANPNGTHSANSSLVTIGAGITLSTAGAWVNDAAAVPAGPIAVDGGTIAIASFGDITIGQGSVLDVSGGGHATSAGKVQGGNGGGLKLTAGLKPTLTPNNSNPQPPSFAVVPLGAINFVGGLTQGQLRGYGLAGSSIGHGGSLGLTSSDIVTITAGGGTLISQLSPGNLTDAASSSPPLIDSPAVVSVSTDLFSSGGFSRVSLTAAGIALPANVKLNPTVSSQRLDTLPPSAPSLAGIATVVRLPQGVRPAASISLHATGDLWNSRDSADPSAYGLTIGGTIATDPKGSVTLIGDQVAVVSGVVNAPGGSITLSGGTYVTPDSVLNGPSPVLLNGEGVWLTGALLAAGTEVAVPQSNGTTFRDVLAGGSVTVSGGDIILAPGAMIDVSGATGNSTLAAAGPGFAGGGAGLSGGAATSTVASAGGTISISAVLGAVLEGALEGRSGGENVAGGTLGVSLTPHNINKSNTVGADGLAVPGGYWPRVENSYITLQSTLQPGDSSYIAADSPLLTPGNNPAANPVNDGNIPLSTAMIAQGGFSSLVLSLPGGTATSLPPAVPGGPSASVGVGYVTFSGNTTLQLPGHVVINAGTILVPYGASDAIRANYFQWNSGINNSSPAVPVPFLADGAPPLAGTSTGKLSIVANNVDLLGDLAVQGGQNPNASALIVGQPLTSFQVAGDLRLIGLRTTQASTDPSSGGSLVSAGDLVFTAGQVYPATETNFTLASATRVAFNANGAPPPAPLSVGGVLNVFAPDIEQNGTLRAPTGTINLGSLTSEAQLQAQPQRKPFDFTTDPVSQSDIGGLHVGTTATLNFGASSLTSVSTDGATTLFGLVQNGTSWFYGGGPIAAPPAKQIVLAGTSITAAPGSKIDASGGGDLFAGEFVPGTGGSKDIFTPVSGPNVYAVIPGYAGITPYDPGISTSGPSAG